MMDHPECWLNELGRGIAGFHDRLGVITPEHPRFGDHNLVLIMPGAPSYVKGVLITPSGNWGTAGTSCEFTDTAQLVCYFVGIMMIFIHRS